MNKLRLTLNALAVVVFTLMVTSLTQAQATRTWVSGVGDDVNPCSRTAPCKTFAGAISKTADGGEIDCIDAAGFGTITITKSITIDGGGTFGSILAAGTNGVNVNDQGLGSKIVTLRNLSINGAGTGVNGINVISGKSLHVENVEIFGFTGNGINATPTTVPAGAAGYEMFFDDVDVRDLKGASSIGIKISAPGSFVAANMDHVRVERVPTGFQVGQNCAATVRNSLFVLGTTGADLLNGSNTIIENTMLTNNTTGIAAGAGSNSFISQVSIILCSTGVSAGGGVVKSSGNNRILGNSNDGALPQIINPK